MCAVDRELGWFPLILGHAEIQGMLSAAKHLCSCLEHTYGTGAFSAESVLSSISSANARTENPARTIATLGKSLSGRSNFFRPSISVIFRNVFRNPADGIC